MPSEQEQVRFLTTCLKHGDVKKVDFHTVANLLGITANAASLRYSRLRKALKEGKTGPSIKPDYLFLCLKHSDFRKIKFDEVAKEMNASINAVSLRWYRLKASYEKQLATKDAISNQFSPSNRKAARERKGKGSSGNNTTAEESPTKRRRNENRNVFTVGEIENSLKQEKRQDSIDVHPSPADSGHCCSPMKDTDDEGRTHTPMSNEDPDVNFEEENFSSYFI